MTHRWYLGAAAAALGLSTVAFAAALLGFIRISHARRESLREWNTNRCSVYLTAHGGAEDPCTEPSRDEPTLISSLKAARADIARAKSAIGRGDDGDAARELAVALDRANATEHRSSMFATMIAARIVSDVLDVVDAHPALTRRGELRAAIARTSLPTAQRPLEADRLRMANGALSDPSSRTLITWGATDARISDDVEHEDALMLAMQHAARRGDRAACESAGRSAMMGPSVCAPLVRATKTAQRLSARSRSLGTDERLDLRPR